jgi:16S rRNA (guanine966-N2)-methyltransferase
MRIIAGSHRGRRLYTPRDRTIRPTADRVRESIFNILGPLSPHTTVLDLFTGTGAMALEAISRGAQRALLLDIHPQALKVAQKNIRSLDMENQATLLRWNIARNLSCLKGRPETYELVFMDPPYDQGLVASTLQWLPPTASLESTTRLVVEHSTKEIPDIENLPFEIFDSRSYGKVLVTFLSPML